MIFKIVTNKAMLTDCFNIRKTVFVEEQGVPLAHELDAFEDDCTHVIGYDHQGKPIACGRFRNDNTSVKVERIAVIKSYRRTGVGKKLMLAIEQFIHEQGYSYVTLHAQIHAKPFYKLLGYSTVGQPFMEEQIEHIKMEKYLY
ncbi:MULTISPECIES: GNAT family N-acetyltransferase [Staphylococcus]|jgi:predicted GNAT family N-acyltransferase|uniref:GCN5-related N-acetyltransferase n=2 Tax=Staphylococcus TaxID=1279 RepID=A0ABX6BXX8_STALU|nr:MULTISPECIES: GNAT family N-acetyltransferase [Staphylococcus]ADC87912.1 GNAT family acetyltransferase YjcF [Staphylococcus lugdunensis HKU09-01]AMG62791.1 GNAT family N-acetyltransferase [Staphylococcus lugdunensis]ARB78137.1 GNAT family N-acetyltransferase [Staphylococcus lugdunensis]ARJ09660.1 GNAT family N-acetyltransferase [Staphylococcus lugdunensis]ARJ19258.1 GNAT family N-acetyltransferase [Staphylococcus lugdunensis]